MLGGGVGRASSRVRWGKKGSYGGPEDGPENVRRPWRVDVLEAQQSVSGRKHGSCVSSAGEGEGCGPSAFVQWI